MGNRAWNVVFRNTSRDSCRLRGWPRIAVRTSAGKPVPTTVSDVTSSNLAVIQVATIVLRPGDSAVVTATSATAPGALRDPVVARADPARGGQSGTCP